MIPTPEDNKKPNPPDNLPVQQEAEFLKREEVKTMERDVAELREIEAKKERERIASLRPSPPPIPPAPTTRFFTPPPPPPPPPPLPTPPAPPLPRQSPPSFSHPYKKFVIRGLIIILSLFVLGFGFWLWQGKNTQAPQPAKTEAPDPVPEISLPPSLISTQDTKLIGISSNEEIPAILEQLLKIEIATSSFSRVAIKNSKENRWASLNDLDSAFKINAPPEIFGKLDPNFTLAIFSQKEGNRITLIAKITDSPGLIDPLKTLEKNFAQSKSSFFKTAHYQGRSFRYLTLGKNDFGVVYLVLDDYLVITSSYESMKNVVNELTLEKK